MKDHNIVITCCINTCYKPLSGLFHFSTFSETFIITILLNAVSQQFWICFISNNSIEEMSSTSQIVSDDSKAKLEKLDLTVVGDSEESRGELQSETSRVSNDCIPYEDVESTVVLPIDVTMDTACQHSLTPRPELYVGAIEERVRRMSVVWITGSAGCL
jgi:hypothetical protein